MTGVVIDTGAQLRRTQHLAKYQWTADHGFGSRKGTSSLPQRGTSAESDFADVLKIA